MRKLFLPLVIIFMTSTLVIAQGDNGDGVPGKDDAPVVVFKVGTPLDLRSEGKVIADELAKFGSLVNHQDNLSDPLSIFDPAVTLLGHNVQVNDPALDKIQSFPGLTRPFVQFTQSETTIAVHGRNEVVTYNTYYD